MKRVLIGDFGAIATLGLREILEDHCDIVAEGMADEEITDRVRATAAQVVLLDVDSPGTRKIATVLAAHDPAVTVIGCSLTEPRLVVLAGPGAPQIAELQPSSLLEAVNGS